MLRILTLLSLLPFLTVACGKDYKNQRTTGKIGINYSFKGADDCQTGQQIFETKKAMCAALLDEERNQSCAKDKRHENYKKECEEFGKLEDLIKPKKEGEQSPFPGIANPENTAEERENRE